MAYDPQFEQWWNTYYANDKRLKESDKMLAHHAWVARGHKEFIDKIDKDLKINDPMRK